MVPEYMCQGRSIQCGRPVCQQIAGSALDDAIGMLLVETVTPLTLEVALAVQKELESRCDETERLRVGVALEEALNNAYYHGNLEISSNGNHDRKKYMELAHDRCNELPYCDRRIHVHAKVSPHEAVFVIRDEGNGFDVARWQSDGHSSGSDQSFGRGIVLMRSIMDDVKFNSAGNEVTLVKRSVMIDDEDCDD